MNPDIDDRLMVSESLVDRMPDLTEQALQQEDSFIVCTVAFEKEGDIELMSGLLVGTSIDNAEVKVDVRVDMSEAFSVIEMDSRGDVIKCKTIYLKMGDSIVEIAGPLVSSCIKVMDFDKNDKRCTLGLDFKRTQVNEL